MLSTKLNIRLDPFYNNIFVMFVINQWKIINFHILKGKTSVTTQMSSIILTYYIERDIAFCIIDAWTKNYEYIYYFVVNSVIWNHWK